MLRAGRRRVLAGLALLASLGLEPASLPAAGRGAGRPLAEAPAWVQAAAARPVPPGVGPLVVVLQEKVVAPLAAGGVRVTRRWAARINAVSALQETPPLLVRYRTGDLVEVAAGWAVTPDGRVHTPHPKDDVADFPWVDGGDVFVDSRIRSVQVPGLMVGGMVAFESVVLEQFDLGADAFWFGSGQHPTLLSRLLVEVPAGWSWDAHEERLEGVSREVNGNRAVYTARDLQPPPAEDLRPPVDDLLPAVWIRWRSPDGRRGHQTWQEVGHWYRALAEPVMETRGRAAGVAAGAAPAGPDDLLPAVSRAFDYAARQVRYVSIQIGIGGWQPSTPDQVAGRLYGDCKDKSFLLRAMLEEWGLKTFPVLVRTRGQGDLVEEVPSPAQFDHAIAAVVLPEGVGQDLWAALDLDGIGRVLFLDATVREAAAWELRTDVQGTRALLVTPAGGRLVWLPVQPPSAGGHRALLEARVGGDGGLLDARQTETWTGSEAVEVRARLAGVTTGDRQREIRARLQGRFPGVQMTGYRIAGLERPGAPVEEVVEMAGGQLGKRVGHLLVLEPGRRRGAGSCPSARPAATRWRCGWSCRKAGLPRRSLPRPSPPPPGCGPCAPGSSWTAG